MAKRRFSFELLLNILFETLDVKNGNPNMRIIFNAFGLIFYFTQMLGYIAKFQFEIYEPKLLILMEILFYSNFANFLIFFQSRIVVLFCYFAVMITLLLFFGYFGVLTLTKIYYKHKKIKIFEIFCPIISSFFSSFYWFWGLPFLEIMINPLSCGFKGSFINTCDEKLSSYFLIISIIMTILIVVLMILHLYLHCNYEFLDLYSILLKFNIFSLVSLIFRISMPIFFSSLNEKDYILLIFLQLFLLISLINFLQCFPIRSPVLSSLYFSLLLSSQLLILILACWKYLNILLEESLFYSIMVTTVLSFKLGFSYSFRKKFDIFLSNFSYTHFIDYALEELFFLFDKFSGSNKHFFLLLGMLKFHAKNCSSVDCKLKSKTMKKYLGLPLIKQTSLLNSFIHQRFALEIQKQTKNKGNMNERLIFKFISYLIRSNCNTYKAFYETQKMKLMYQNRTFIGKVIIKMLVRKVEQKVQDIERERSIIQNKTAEGLLETQTFFRISREKVELEKLSLSLIKEKIDFWETYKEGFESYDDLALKLNELFRSYRNYYENIKEIQEFAINQNEKIVVMRFLSIYHCILLNHLTEALKFEDKIDTLKKKFIHIDAEKLSPIVFIKDNLVVCEASFLNNQGKILESSKTEKLANFFGYDINDLKSIDMISAFMPGIIAEYHTKLIFWSFIKTRKEQIAFDFQVLSHALDKKGFLFPIKLFLGFNLRYSDDYVASAGILKLQESGYEEVLLDEEGKILGFNKEFYELIKKEQPKITLDQVKSLSFYSLVPKIKEIIESEQIYKDKKSIAFRNQMCFMSLPYNLIEISELLNYFKNEMLGENTNKNSHSAFASSSNTFKTMRSNYSSTEMNKGTIKSLKIMKDFNIRLNNFLNKYETLKPKKEIISNLFQDNNTSLFQLMSKTMEDTSCKKYKINLDLSFKYHRYGKANNNIIILAQVVLTKLTPLNKLENEGEIFKTYNNLSNIQQDNNEESLISDPFINGIVLPPQNSVGFGLEFERLSVSERSKPQIQKYIEEPHYPNISIESSKKDVDSNIEKNKNKNKINFNDIDSDDQIKNNPFKKIDFRDSCFPSNKNQNENENRKEYSPQKSFSSEKITIEKFSKNRLNNKTTDNFLIREMELAASQKSSSSSTNKKAFNVLSMIETLSKKLPKNLYQIIYLLILQLLMILIYCLVYYIIAGQYITDTYVPLNDTSFNHLEIKQRLTLATSVLMEFENENYNLTNLTLNSRIQLNNMLNNCYSIALQRFYDDRSAGYSFSFSNYLQTDLLIFIDQYTYEIKEMIFADVIDQFLNLLSQITGSIIQDNVSTSLLNIISRNYLSFTEATSNLRQKIDDEFQKSNEIVTEKLIIALALVLTFVCLIKFIELVILNHLYLKITRLLNIFLRTSPTDAINDIFFLKDTLEMLKNKDASYMSLNFSEKLMNKKNYTLALEENNNLSRPQELKQTKKGKKNQGKVKYGVAKKTRTVSTYAIRPFSKIKIFAFLLITLSASLIYFIFNFYFWSTSNVQIEYLLEKITLFNNLYRFSAAVLVYNNLLIREQIIRDPLYEATGAYYQNHNNRLSIFSEKLSARIETLEGFLRELPIYTLKANSDINEKNFTNLVQGNVCEVLLEKNRISQDYVNECENYLDGAFKNGILNLMNSFVNHLKSFNYLTNMTVLKSEEDISKRNENIKDFIKSNVYLDTVLSSYLVNEAMAVFYDYFSKYYLDQLNLNIEQLTLFIWIMCSFCLVLLLVLLIIKRKFLVILYKNSAASLGLISVEKLSFDEQTIFLIKNLYKEHC